MIRHAAAFAFSLVSALCASISMAQVPIPFPKTPSYESDKTGVTTGGVFCDLNRDSWPDLVVANGNDIRRQRVAVYYNKKNGTFPTNPDWVSSDIDYHGHLDVGDVNGDGWPDVVVSVFLGPRGFSEKGRVKLYLNNGKGTLGTKPAWSSADKFFSFSCALGDVDGDGDLDLFVATGEAYKNPMDKDRLYLNTGGKFSSLPSWTSSVLTHSMDATWCDVDADGDLDLATAGERGPNRLYLNNAGKLPTTPSWSSTDGGTRHNGNSCIFADVDGDGRPDLVVSDNRQLGGTGTFRVYKNLGKTFTTTPWWQSSRFHNGYTSGVNFLDFDRDGDLDLCGGGWWTQTSWYRNTRGKLSMTPSWETTGTSVVEAIFFADVNRDGLRPVKGEKKLIRAGRKLYGFAHGPVESLQRVMVDGKGLTPAQYAFHREGAWISLAKAPTASLSLDYTISEAADMGVTNWDRTKGNYVFLREPVVKAGISGPTKTSYTGGQIIAWNESVAVTTVSPQYLVYRTTLDLPGTLGSFTLLNIPIVLPGAIKISPIPQLLPLPRGLPSIFKGTYKYRLEILDLNAIVISRAGFAFLFTP